MNEAQVQITIPHLFRCPISLDLFEDPVTLCTGHTYDRSSIEKWLSAGNLTCPVTMQKLHDPSIVPNHTLRHLIDQWLQLGLQFDPGNSASIDYLATLKHSLESPEATLQSKLQALEKIRVLSDEYCSFKKSCFHQLGFLPLLLELVFGKEDDATSLSFSENHMEFAEAALSCIVKLLPLVSLEPLNMIKDESKLATFLQLLEKGTSSVKTSLCHVIDSTAAISQTDGVHHTFGNSHKLVHEIVLLIHQNCDEVPVSASVSVSNAAIRAMSALCSMVSTRESLVKAGAIEAIIAYISETREKNMAPLAMAAMKKLVVLESGKEALLNHPKGIETLVKMVFKVCNQECSEIAVGVLLILCRDSGRAREEAIDGGVLTQLLFLLQSQCCIKTKAKARMLLKLLRSKWVEEPRKPV